MHKALKGIGIIEKLNETLLKHSLIAIKIYIRVFQIALRSGGRWEIFLAEVFYWLIGI